MIHSQQCIDAQMTRTVMRQGYVIAFPHYCRECNGWGYMNPHQEPGYGDMDFCEACFMVGQCPRCEKVGLQASEEAIDEHCPECGWFLMESKGMPPDWQCEGNSGCGDIVDIISENDFVTRILKQAEQGIIPGPIEAITDASGVIWSRSCSWCDTLNPSTEPFCSECKHMAHVPRMNCQCSKCHPIQEESKCIN